MRLNWKFLGSGILSLLVLLGTGCSGINASHSVSPATFLLPGLIKADPPAENPDITLPATEPARAAQS